MGVMAFPRREFQPEAFEFFLETLAKTGRTQEACRLANIRPCDLKKARVESEEINLQVLEAEQDYAEEIMRHVHERATGVAKQPLHFKGELTGHEMPIYSDRMLELEAKRVVKGYRPNNIEVESGAESGVLAIPVIIKTDGKYDSDAWVQTIEGSEDSPSNSPSTPDDASDTEQPEQ